MNWCRIGKYLEKVTGAQELVGVAEGPGVAQGKVTVFTEKISTSETPLPHGRLLILSPTQVLSTLSAE